MLEASSAATERDVQAVSVEGDVDDGPRGQPKPIAERFRDNDSSNIVNLRFSLGKRYQVVPSWCAADGRGGQVSLG